MRCARAWCVLPGPVALPQRFHEDVERLCAGRFPTVYRVFVLSLSDLVIGIGTCGGGSANCTSSMLTRESLPLLAEPRCRKKLLRGREGVPANDAVTFQLDSARIPTCVHCWCHVRGPSPRGGIRLSHFIPQRIKNTEAHMETSASERGRLKETQGSPPSVKLQAQREHTMKRHEDTEMDAEGERARDTELGGALLRPLWSLGSYVADCMRKMF